MLADLLVNLPEESGVYLMKDEAGDVIYIGKAKNLRKRVNSYFNESAKHPPRISLMVSLVRDIEYIVTDNETEALVLEANLIKKHQPRFNVLLKDDKRYPYVCISFSEKYPRIFITRKRGKISKLDRYYGPYVDVNGLKKTLEIIKNIFPLRQRKQPLYKNRPCLNYDLGKCPGVCQNLITPEEYLETVKKVSLIFQGRVDELLEKLQQEMKIAAEKLEFEKAARYRDQIKTVQHLFDSSQTQKVALPDDNISRDAVAIAQDENRSCIQLFQIRSGNLIGRLIFFTDNGCNDDKGEILQRVLEQYYHQIEPAEIPSEILIQFPLKDKEIFSKWLREKKGKKVTITIPKRHQKADLITLVAKNAQRELEKSQKLHQNPISALEDLAKILGLPTPPRRIEGYDISHIQGTNVVASRVVFIDGLPAKQYYRHYNIQSPDIKPGHSDDFLAIREVIKRRFSKEENLPDLVMIDGGKGQLSSACLVLEEMGLLPKIKVISLAKKREEIFVPGNPLPLQTNKEQIGVKLLRQIRDETHRFAITFHRHKRLKASYKSVLDEIPGLGEVRKKMLLSHFNSIENIRQASVKQLQEVSGIGPQLATAIYNYFRQEKC
ncbi:MAG: excinuclease ABC subunit UvrC [Geminocystis sp.]|nr:excinuclease ABC subunit UvrC [Geminocystis sp.]MCS7148861.1 excinuclease ABC subunit UvrC [Geminocystis sp.]MDW8115945.1 excinuclease ABC subunit UvrC [Geminocystis sp.]MDW8463714.1 excinuclease ABC subunit UvrC [Geminocystis sp.]